MSSKLAEITQDALRLPHDEQLRLARTLLERSEATGQPAVDGAWEEEIERRIKSIDAGLAKSRPFAEVVAEIHQQLGDDRRRPRLSRAGVCRVICLHESRAIVCSLLLRLQLLLHHEFEDNKAEMGAWAQRGWSNHREVTSDR